MPEASQPGAPGGFAPQLGFNNTLKKTLLKAATLFQAFLSQRASVLGQSQKKEEPVRFFAGGPGAGRSAGRSLRGGAEPIPRPGGSFRQLAFFVRNSPFSVGFAGGLEFRGKLQSIFQDVGV